MDKEQIPIPPVVPSGHQLPQQQQQPLHGSAQGPVQSSAQAVLASTETATSHQAYIPMLPVAEHAVDQLWPNRSSWLNFSWLNYLDRLVLVLVSLLLFTQIAILLLPKPVPVWHLPQLAHITQWQSSNFSAESNSVIPPSESLPAQTHAVKNRHKTYPKKPLPSKIVNINQAGPADLMTLPGVGPKMAEAIMAYRKQTGGFKQPESLMDVKGIGPKKFAKIKPFVRV